AAQLLRSHRFWVRGPPSASHRSSVRGRNSWSLSASKEAVPRSSSELRAEAARKMINLFKIKGQKKDEAASATGKAPVKKQSAGELRLHKDISELNLPKTTSISFPNGKDDLMNFEITIRPDEGYYMGGAFVFTFQVSPSYPHDPPKQPNDEDPLNHEAAAVLRGNPKMFEANVKRAMTGGYVGQHYFQRCLA
ncbi:hypothetical protein Zm00014a_024182, partial [Zea mays]